MRKYLSLILVAMLVACGDTEGSGQTGSSATSSGSGSGGAGGSDSGSGSGGAGGAEAGSGGAGGASIAPVDGEASTTRSCAPDDGPAFAIKIGLSERTCSAVAAGPLLTITFFTNVDSPAGKTWKVSSSEAQGIYQPDGDPSNVVNVKMGTLSVTTWDASSATGSYDVILNDGTHLAGPFDAIACLMDQPLCG